MRISRVSSWSVENRGEYNGGEGRGDGDREDFDPGPVR